MAFIGVISNKKTFDNIKTEILKLKQNCQINIIHINLKSIQNIKNIRFETIIIESELTKFQEQETNIKKICETASYILINTDFNVDYPNFNNTKANIVTYGLNQKAVVTVSSITDSDILIYWQKSLKNKKRKKIDIEERRIKIKDKNTLKVYEILIIYTIFRIYSCTIMEEI